MRKKQKKKAREKLAGRSGAERGGAGREKGKRKMEG